MFAGVAAALTVCAPSEAIACVPTATGQIAFGAHNSFNVQSTQLNGSSATAVLSCQIPILQLLPGDQYMRATVTAPTGSFVLTGPSGDTISYRLYALNGAQEEILYGQTKNLYTNNILNLLGLLGGSSAAFPIFARTDAANVAAGLYQGTFTINWSWHYCEVIVALGLCLPSWQDGTGSTTVTVTLEVLPSCSITAPDIDFGQAPMAALFGDVSQNVAVTCTKDLNPFYVAIDDGLSPGSGRRAMTSGGNRLEYNLFKGSTTEVWGESGAARAQNPAPANGTSPQLFPYTARIYADQDTPPPGVYTDQLVVEVSLDP